MQLPTSSTLLTILTAASLTMAAPATLPSVGTLKSLITARVQFELERQTTFIQRPVPVPGRIQLNTKALTAKIVSVSDDSTGADADQADTLAASCQAFDAQGNEVGAPILLDVDTILNGGELAAIAAVECVSL